MSPKHTPRHAKSTSNVSRGESDGREPRIRNKSAGVPLCMATIACVSGFCEAIAATRTDAAARVAGLDPCVM